MMRPWPTDDLEMRWNTAISVPTSWVHVGIGGHTTVCGEEAEAFLVQIHFLKVVLRWDRIRDRSQIIGHVWWVLHDATNRHLLLDYVHRRLLVLIWIVQVTRCLSVELLVQLLEHEIVLWLLVIDELFQASWHLVDVFVVCLQWLFLQCRVLALMQLASIAFMSKDRILCSDPARTRMQLVISVFGVCCWHLCSC